MLTRKPIRNSRGRPQRLPGSARAVSRTRDRNRSSTTDNCRRRAAAAADALRAYCCTAEHRHYAPSHEKAGAVHGVETEEATPPGCADVASRPTGIHHLTKTLRRFHKGVLSTRRPVGASFEAAAPQILRPTGGTTWFECFLGRSCVRIRRSFLRETKTRSRECSMVLCGRPSRAHFQEVHQYQASLFLSAVSKRICKFKTTHFFFAGVFIIEKLSSNRVTI